MTIADDLARLDDRGADQGVEVLGEELDVLGRVEDQVHLTHVEGRPLRSKDDHRRRVLLALLIEEPANRSTATSGDYRTRRPVIAHRP